MVDQVHHSFYFSPQFHIIFCGPCEEREISLFSDLAIISSFFFLLFFYKVDTYKTKSRLNKLTIDRTCTISTPAIKIPSSEFELNKKISNGARLVLPSLLNFQISFQCDYVGELNQLIRHNIILCYIGKLAMQVPFARTSTRIVLQS